MENEIFEKIKEQDAKLDAIYRSVEKTRKYIFWKTITGVLFFILPLVGVAFLIPWIIKNLNSFYGELGL